MAPVTHSKRFGWAGLLQAFLETSLESWLRELAEYHASSLHEPAVASQITAWRQSFLVLQSELADLVTHLPSAKSWGIIFEYELPRERGRRPDVILLTSRSLVVLEFKGHLRPARAHFDQVAAYSRDLQAYHAGSHALRPIPILVMTSGVDRASQVGDITLAGSEDLGAVLRSQVGEEPGVATDTLWDWLNDDYAPLPTLVSAARSLFLHEPLPAIRRAQSAGIPATLAHLSTIAEQARSGGEHHLALITGVPGAGKTLVGLQFVYATHFGQDETTKQAVFLSGNGPLVKVLQHALKSTIFVQDVHGFLRQYGGEQRRLPKERIWIYDEAQRAWDGERVREKRGHGASEPADFMQIGGRMGAWSMIVGLIGEGQEIHLGEEAGMGQWNDAIRGSGVPWHVHCPERLSDVFGAARAVSPSPTLDLDTSLRSHVAEDVQTWVKALLSGSLETASASAERMTQQGFCAYLTRERGTAESYVRERYAGEMDKRYGWLASSKAANLDDVGLHNSYQYTRRFREGPWFNDDPDSPDSCCQLDEVATEFQCQGLELDLPLIAWGDDLWWEQRTWRSRPSPRSKAKDPHRLRLNSDRVLLSRGRDGVVVYVPPDGRLDNTFAALKAGGIATI